MKTANEKDRKTQSFCAQSTTTMRCRYTSVASLALVAVMSLCVVPTPTTAIDAKCSACEAVATELQEALERERPRNHLDMRGRLDSKGNRLGRMIDYKVSELRFVELLESLCPDVGDYSLSEPKDGGPKVWSKDKRLGGAKGKAQRAEIEGYCHRIVEEQEEALQGALYANELNSTNVEDLLCRKFTKECKGKKKKVPPPPSTDDAVDGNAGKKGATEGDAVAAEKPAKKGKKGKKSKKGKNGASDASAPDPLSSFRDSMPKDKDL